MSDDPTPKTDDTEADRDTADDASPTSGDEQPCADQPLEVRLEALLLSTDRPLTESRLASLTGQSGQGSTIAVKNALASLNEQYEQTGRSFRAERLAGGWQLLTLQTFAPLLARLHTDRQQTRLSQAALETLAIVAYRQPIMRAEIEAIRGVAVGEVLRSLLERRLVKIVGRAEELGRPMLYGTTNEFLKVFGLSSIDDVPDVQGLKGKGDEGKRTGQKELQSSREESSADRDSSAETSASEPSERASTPSGTA